jgi:hypothetical protein
VFLKYPRVHAEGRHLIGPGVDLANGEFELVLCKLGIAVMLTSTAANQARIMRRSDTRCFAIIDPFSLQRIGH